MAHIGETAAPLTPLRRALRPHLRDVAECTQVPIAARARAHECSAGSVAGVMVTVLAVGSDPVVTSRPRCCADHSARDRTRAGGR